MSSDLAIVIPAYKETYFAKTLNSLARQTNKNFTVYIGDDCSPFNLEKIADSYQDKLTIYYTRFADNIGSRNLVLQWQRCVALTHQEKWLWLFSDDDLMDESCVARFYETVSNKADYFDVYRFDTVTIDTNDAVMHHNATGPEIESAEQMAYHLLKGERGNSMPDHIFTRERYNYCGGFVFTEFAQGADWATSILFAQKKGICIIPDAKIYWRYSGSNISSIASANKNIMINGHLQFIMWVLKHFEYLRSAPAGITYTMMLDALRINLKLVMIHHYKGFNLNYALPLLNFYHQKLKLSYYRSFNELIEIQGAFFPVIHKLLRLRNKVKSKFIK